MANEVSSLTFAAASEVDEKSWLETLEASLRQREYELEEAHRIARLGTWRWNFVTDTVTWSKEVFITFGLDPQGPIPRHGHMQALHTPESWERMIAAVGRMKAEGVPYALDIDIQLADGTRRWIHTRGEVAARGPDGEVTEARGTVQNVTERKLAEMKLQERDEELSEAHRLNKLGTWRLDVPTGKVSWSEEIFRIFGLEPGGDVPSPDVHRTLFTLESYERMTSALYLCRDKGVPYEVDGEIHARDGVTRWIAARGHVARRDEHGEILELRGTIQDVTERKLTETMLRERERELLEVQRIAGVGAWRWIAATDELTWSDELYRIFEWDTKQKPPRIEQHEALMTPESWARTVELLHSAKECGEPFHFDSELVLPSGQPRYITSIGEAVLDSDCNVVELRGTVRDITLQKQSEAALRETQSRFQKLYDSDLIGIGFPESGGSIVEGNDMLLRIIGYTREDMKAGLVRWDTMTPPEYREADLVHIAEAHERGSCTPYEKEYIRKDGSRVPILCGFARLDHEKSESIGFIMDLSAQKQAEQEVRERELRFRELADSLPQLVWVSDPNGDRTYTNQYYLNYLGLPMEAVLGGRWSEYLHPDDVDRTMKRWMYSMATGEPYSNEYRIRRHDGMYRSFLVRGVAVRNDAGEIQRWLGSATDIHDQKIAEEALRRTEKLAVTGRLAASIAHEINNPLEAVTNSLYLALQDGGLSCDTRMYLKMAEQELTRVSQLTTQTLRFHRQSVAASEADLSELMDSAYELFSSRFEACNIKLQREYQPGMMLFCRGDELRQVFANLLSNALDAMRHGGTLRIRIRTGHSWGRDASIGVRVVVCDSGSGIPLELRKKIFEPFISTKADTGTGLGLWVSEGIVKKHRGRISLYSDTSAVNHGTVFSLFFPLDGINSDQGGDVGVQAGDLP